MQSSQSHTKSSPHLRPKLIAIAPLTQAKLRNSSVGITTGPFPSLFSSLNPSQTLSQSPVTRDHPGARQKPLPLGTHTPRPTPNLLLQPLHNVLGCGPIVVILEQKPSFPVKRGETMWAQPGMQTPSRRGEHQQRSRGLTRSSKWWGSHGR